MVLSTAEIVTKPAVTNFSSTAEPGNATEGKKTAMTSKKSGDNWSTILILDYTDRFGSKLFIFGAIVVTKRAKGRHRRVSFS